MTITLELPPDLEARLLAEAKAKGIPIGEVVKAYLYSVPPEGRANQLTADEVNRGLDEAADLIPEGIPALSDDAMSRESIYTREDDWNQ
jgi:hypothetical protein